MRVTLTCTAKGGGTIAENSCDVFVFPRPDSTMMVKAAFHDPAGRLGALPPTFRLARPASGEGAGVTVTTRLDEQVMERLGAGETVLCLADSTTQVPEHFPFTLIRRDTAAWYDGNWASSLSWVRRSRPPFSEVNFGPTIGFEAAAMGLPLVIGNIKPEDFSDVLSGMFVGWVHLNAGYVAQVRAGKGKLVLCTLPLAAECGRDPYATTVLGALLKYCAHQELSPGIVWDIPHQGGGS